MLSVWGAARVSFFIHLYDCMAIHRAACRSGSVLVGTFREREEPNRAMSHLWKTAASVHIGKSLHRHS
jgi:hypothetical protein